MTKIVAYRTKNQERKGEEEGPQVVIGKPVRRRGRPMADQKPRALRVKGDDSQKRHLPDDNSKVYRPGDRLKGIN